MVDELNYILQDIFGYKLYMFLCICVCIYIFTYVLSTGLSTSVFISASK